MENMKKYDELQQQSHIPNSLAHDLRSQCIK